MAWTDLDEEMQLEPEQLRYLLNRFQQAASIPEETAEAEEVEARARRPVPRRRTR